MKLNKQRRMENKTNYRKRLILLKGKSPRLVVRKTNRYIIVQIVESVDAQDKIIYSGNTKELLKHGWPKDKEGSLKSVAAAYLIGLLVGKKAKGIKERVILDLGLIPNTKGSKIYAVVKGISDSGIEINYDEEVIPSKERLEGKDTKVGDIFAKIKDKIK